MKRVHEKAEIHSNAGVANEGGGARCCPDCSEALFRHIGKNSNHFFRNPSGCSLLENESSSFKLSYVMDCDF